MEINNLQEDNMYNALAEIVYRLPLDEYTSDSKYGILTSSIFTLVKWDSESPIGISSEVDLEDRKKLDPEDKKKFVNTFMLEKPRG